MAFEDSFRRWHWECLGIGRGPWEFGPHYRAGSPGVERAGWPASAGGVVIGTWWIRDL